MRQKFSFQSRFVSPRGVAASALSLFGVLLGMFSLAATPPVNIRGRSTTVPPPPATTAGWSIVGSPSAGFAPASLSAVTCMDASDCWAMGRSEIGQTYTDTTLMRWDGASWQIVPSPSVSNKTNGLVAIACVSSSNCWAVGYQITLQTVQVQTLTLHWDGTSWQIVPSPNVGNGFNALYGVACTSDSNCWAVGFENGGSLAQTLIERWDGNSWSIVASPNVGTEHNVLNAVTCVSASDCRGVGYTGVAGAKSALVAQWDGNAWTASALPNQLTSQEDILSSVTCTSTSSCWAVGNSYNGTVHQTLIEQWNGTSWASVTAPEGGVDNYLVSVVCNSTSDCWAVGDSTNAAVDPQAFDQDLILHWNGSVWSLSAPPLDEAATYANDLTGVACALASQCWAVGQIQPGGSNTSLRSLILSWDGTSWTSVAAPDVPAIASNYLDGMTCVSATDCWAVGFNFYGTIVRSLILHWDGTTWGLTDSPNTAIDRSNYLSDVTCVTDSDCWAVGQSSDTLDRQRQALAMHWDGTSWSINNPSPVDTSQAAETDMESIACVSTSDCWTVGFTSITQDPRLAPWIQHWDGQAWASFPAPAAQYNPTSDNILYAVFCNSTSDCWAVGTQGTVPDQTLIDHWDGTSWSAVTSPNTSPGAENALYGVTCATSTDCWAVGHADRTTGDQMLVLHWDGLAWSVADSPASPNSLLAVTCVSGSDCWAVGQRYGPSLFVHWDGTTWSIVDSPNGKSNGVAGISCTSSSDCWGVGQYSAAGIQQTLILHYAPSPPLMSVVSRKAHGGAGTFDINLPLTGNAGIECRNGGANGDYTLVFSFTNPLVTVDGASVARGTGSVSSNDNDASDPRNYIVNLTGVTDAQAITVSLNNVTDSLGNVGNVSNSMGVLMGDTNGDGFVNSADISQTKSQSGQPVTATNFREDVNTDGFINSADISLVKSKSGIALP